MASDARPNQGFHSMSEYRRVRLMLEAWDTDRLRTAIQCAALPEIKELARRILSERAEHAQFGGADAD